MVLLYSVTSFSHNKDDTPNCAPYLSYSVESIFKINCSSNIIYLLFILKQCCSLKFKKRSTQRVCLSGIAKGCAVKQR